MAADVRKQKVAVGGPRHCSQCNASRCEMPKQLRCLITQVEQGQVRRFAQIQNVSRRKISYAWGKRSGQSTFASRQSPRPFWGAGLAADLLDPRHWHPHPCTMQHAMLDISHAGKVSTRPPRGMHGKGSDAIRWSDKTRLMTYLKWRGTCRMNHRGLGQDVPSGHSEPRK
jgi:hypothetical protein